MDLVTSGCVPRGFCACRAADSVLEGGLFGDYPLPDLSNSYFVGGYVEVWLRLDVSGPCPSPLSDLPLLSADREVPGLRLHLDVAGGSMRLTPRCMDLLRLLRTARWLTTGQVHARFFSHASLDAARKRLRKLTAKKYLFMVQRQRMDHAIFTLGREGKRMLERISSEPVVLEYAPPVQRQHFCGVNDVRIAAELSGLLSYFFAYWELPRLGWPSSVIPDGLFSMKEQTFAVEFDRGSEGTKFFIRTKIAEYERGLAFPISTLLIVTDSTPRMSTLAKAIADVQIPVLFSTIDLIRGQGIMQPIFYRTPSGEGVSIV